MPRIVQRQDYNGAKERIARLGLSVLWAELEGILTGFKLLIKEQKDGNGGAAVRRMIDAEFDSRRGWRKIPSGGIDWTKCRGMNGAEACLGVEVQVSGRSDLLIVDITHLRESIQAGQIDVGVVVVPSDSLRPYLTDRAPGFKDGMRAVDRARADEFPLVVLGIEHDGTGPALAKERTRQGRRPHGSAGAGGALGQVRSKRKKPAGESN